MIPQCRLFDVGLCQAQEYTPAICESSTFEDNQRKQNYTEQTKSDTWEAQNCIKNPSLQISTPDFFW